MSRNSTAERAGTTRVRGLGLSDLRLEFAEILVRLFELDGSADPNADTAWAEEIKRRVAAVEAGTEPLESWAEAKRRISREILGR